MYMKKYTTLKGKCNCIVACVRRKSVSQEIEHHYTFFFVIFFVYYKYCCRLFVLFVNNQL